MLSRPLDCPRGQPQPLTPTDGAGYVIELCPRRCGLWHEHQDWQHQGWGQ